MIRDAPHTPQTDLARLLIMPPGQVREPGKAISPTTETRQEGPVAWDLLLVEEREGCGEVAGAVRGWCLKLGNRHMGVPVAALFLCFCKMFPKEKAHWMSRM